MGNNSEKAPLNVYIEIQKGKNNISREELVERVKQAWISTGHSADQVEMVDIYVKTQENRAYYVINKCESGSIILF